MFVGLTFGEANDSQESKHGEDKQGGAEEAQVHGFWFY